MARLSLPLQKMSVPEKLEVIERVWQSLRGEEGRFDSPAWHAELLAARKARHAQGKTGFSAWPEAKDRIRKRVRAS